ncbi:hypothetical protein IQ66_16430, partial [Leptospira borgpetersenii serovar Ballum]
MIVILPVPVLPVPVLAGCVGPWIISMLVILPVPLPAGRLGDDVEPELVGRLGGDVEPEFTELELVESEFAELE